jgi:hypothetical protein
MQAQFACRIQRTKGKHRMKTKTLSMKNMEELFDVTAMTIHNWKKGSATKAALPAEFTPAAVKRWALKNTVRMTCEPADLLGKDVGKPGPKPRVDAEERRRAEDARDRARINSKHVGKNGLQKLAKAARYASPRPLSKAALAALKQPKPA